MFDKGTYYRILKVEMTTIDALRVSGKLPKDKYEVLNTGVEGEEYPDSKSWVKAKELKDKLGPDYYAAKKAFDHECYMNRNLNKE